MKYYLKYIIIGIACLGLFGCAKDHSNFDYHTINEISISDSLSTGTLSIVVGDSLVLKPIVSSTINKDTSAYSYTWDVWENTSGSSYAAPRTVLSSTKALRYLVSGNPLSVGKQYQLRYTVTDTTTGVSSYLLYQLNIIGNYQKGWLFLEDNNDQTDLTLMKSDSVIMHNLYSSRGTYVPLGTPQKISVTTFSVTDDLSEVGKRLYLVGKDNISQLDYSSMEVVFNANDLFFNAPALNLQNLQWAGRSDGSVAGGVIFNNGKLHYNLVGGFPGEKKWGATLVSTTFGNDYNLYPYLAYGDNYYSPLSTVVYDNLNRRFYTASSSGLDDIALTKSDASIFSMNNVGLTMLNMDFSNVSAEWNCIMKDDQGQPYYLRFSCNATIATLAKNAIPNTNILQAGTFASSTITPHVYYSIGNNIWSYETTSNTNTQSVSVPNNETITAMYYDKNVVNLIVATYDGSEGKVYFYPVDSFGKIAATPSKSFTGFHKIVDIAYKTE